MASARRSFPIMRKASGNAALNLWCRLRITIMFPVTTFWGAVQSAAARPSRCKDKRVVTSVSNYLMLAVYRMFRRLYQAAPGNVASMFRVTPARWERDADAAMFLQEGELSATMAGENGACPDPAAFEMNTETLARDYPRHATSLMNLIKNSEEVIRKHNA